MTSRPRREWWSLGWVFRCSVSSLMRRDSTATWTSGDPVSPSVLACSPMIFCFSSFNNAMRASNPSDHGFSRVRTDRLPAYQPETGRLLRLDQLPGSGDVLVHL